VDEIEAHPQEVAQMVEHGASRCTWSDHS
jgi:hypothetical protein